MKKYKSLVRQLRKKIKQLEKKEHIFNNPIEIIEEDPTIECENCGNTETRILDLKYVKYEVCCACKHRKKLF